MTDPNWLTWTKQIQAIAQNGLTFTTDPYDKDRYEQLRDLAAEIAAHYSNDDAAHIHGLYAAEQGYMTPKVDVRGAIFRHDKVLLVKEKVDGKWTLPGGWADVGDSPSVAIIREIREEAGYDAKVIKLVGILDREKHGHPPYPFHAYKLFFLCEAISEKQDILHEHESLESDFFSLDNLPPLSIGRVVESQIHRCYEHALNPDLPTYFD